MTQTKIINEIGAEANELSESIPVIRQTKGKRRITYPEMHDIVPVMRFLLSVHIRSCAYPLPDCALGSQPRVPQVPAGREGGVSPQTRGPGGSKEARETIGRIRDRSGHRKVE